MTLKQIWCGVTTGHDYRETDITPDVLSAECVNCESAIRVVLSGYSVRAMRADSKRLGKDILSNSSDYAFPVNAGVVRNVLGPIPVETQRFDPEPLPSGEQIRRGDTLIGVVTPKPSDHPNKAHASTRKRGPNGQFLPGRFTDKRMKAWRKRIRKRAASKKK